jgi:phage head maturation protease
MTIQTLTFAVTSVTSSDEQTRFSGVAYSGGLIPGYGNYGDAAIDLSTITLPDEVFALVDHDPGQRAGKGYLTVSGNELIFSGELFKSTLAGQEVAALFSEGAPWQMSVGIQSKPEYSKQPRAVSVNAQNLTLNTLFTHAAVREVSFVPIGADPNTSVAVFSPALGSTIMDQDELIERLRYMLNLPTLATLEEIILELDKLKTVISTPENTTQGLAAYLSAQTVALAAANKQLQDINLAARKDDIEALFAEVDLSDAEKQPFFDMDDVQFGAVKAHFSTVKPKEIDQSLTQEFAVNGKKPEAVESMQSLNAQMRMQLATNRTQK